MFLCKVEGEVDPWPGKHHLICLIFNHQGMITFITYLAKGWARLIKKSSFSILGISNIFAHVKVKVQVLFLVMPLIVQNHFVLKPIELYK